MDCLFTQAIEECIKDCIDTGDGEIKRGSDNCGDPLVWVSSEWIEYDSEHDVVLLHVRFVDTGRIAYSTVIMETLTEK